MTTAVADAADALQIQEMDERRRDGGGDGGDIDFDSFREVAQFVVDDDHQEESSAPSSATDVAVSKARFVSPKDFVLMKVIGMGAFGKVLQVRNKESKEVLAMKVISKRILKKRGLGYIENMLAERHILSRVGKHPFIVSMHCSFQTREKLFIIMDFLAGGELFLRLGKQGIFLEKTAAFYLSEIVLALDHLHTLGVLHRDLKPENILLGSDGHICLTDFGLAKDFGEGRLDDEKALTICGTQEYMAPEMIAKKGTFGVAWLHSAPFTSPHTGCS